MPATISVNRLRARGPAETVLLIVKLQHARADPATVVTKKFRLKCDRCTRNPVTRAPSLPADDEPDLEILRQARRDR